MGALNGSQIMLFDTDGEALACQRNLTISHSSNLVDTTCKQDNGNRTLIYGLREFTLTCDTLTVFEENYGIETLMGYFTNRTTFKAVIASPDFTTQYWVFDVLIESIEQNDPMEDVASYTVVLAGTLSADNNLFLNGNFEQGTGATFTNWSVTRDGANTIVEGVGMSGGRCIETETISGNTFIEQDPVPLIDGETYVIQIWVKTEAEGTITVSDGNGFDYDTIIVNTPDWSPYTLEITYDNANDAAILFTVDGDVFPVNTVVDLDNFSIKLKY